MIIVNNLIYYNKYEKNNDKEFDLLGFKDNDKKFDIKIERLIERGKINSYNKIENTILNYLIDNRKE